MNEVAVLHPKPSDTVTVQTPAHNALAVFVTDAEQLQTKEYGAPLPPEGVETALPSQSALQLTFVIFKLALIADGEVIGVHDEMVHPLTSATVTQIVAVPAPAEKVQFVG